jgi:hypothetical protein
VPEHIELKPKNFDYKVEIARSLSAGMPFLSVDLYNENGQVYFGELTFFPVSGLIHFVLDFADNEIGNLLDLKIKS